ncbi:MAG TPA: S41 family peptidase, partial [Allosphingosinicella sp.]|nr:S41 family peptidase [Allosphingosinicella sp.]
SVVEALATALDENFVFPDKGKAYAAALRTKLATGGYASFPDGLAFAKAVTDDLQTVHPDGHLRLHPPRPGESGGPRPMMRGPGSEEAIGKSGWIAPGVAYIAFNMFPGDEPTLAKLRSFLTAHSSAKTLIIDARTHRGGGLGEMDVMFPHFFSKPQTLVQMDTRVAVEQRHGSPLEDGPTLVKVKGPEGVVRRSHNVVPASTATGLKNAKIYLLTSERTASAAEHLSLSLKRTGRATLIGETTAGAGHYGGMVPLGGGYAAFIPVGRTFDPETDTGWEGTGVKPDIEVPAERALVEALIRSGVAAADAERLSAEYQPQGSMKRPRPRPS